MPETPKRKLSMPFFSHAKLAIIVLNLKGHVIDCNTSAINLLGYTKRELLANHSSKLLHPDDVMGASKIFARFINNSGKRSFIEYRLRKKERRSVRCFSQF